MVLLAEDLVLHNSDRILLDEVSININEHDKIGIIGKNGCGKTSFLRSLVGDIEVEAGKIIKDKNKRIAYLPQVIEISDTNITIEEYIALNFKYERAKDSYEGTDPLIQLKANLNKLGIDDYSKRVYPLSGGEKRRLMLGLALSMDADLLVLDEPTNHLDNEMMEWLEKYLIKYSKAILMVTHDRYFLERVCNTIAELNRGKLSCFIANYSKYLEMKEASMTFEASENRKRKSFLRKEISWISRGALARTTKDRRRIENYDNELQKYKDSLNDVEQELNIDFSFFPRLGNIIIELDNVCKSYKDRTIIKNLTYKVNENDRIGIIGRNGIGKSTLLNLITGKISADSGTVTIGQTVKFGYFTQENENFESDERVIDYIAEDENKIIASKLLENFMFTKDMQFSPISKLSGGEKRRLRLLKVLVKNPNVLLLDEPSNDLDIESLNALENYIELFKGPVILVSHDRYFLDKIVNEVFEIKEDGNIEHYLGNYQTYFEKKQNEVKISNNEIKEKVVQTNKNSNKMTYKEKMEFSTIESEIQKLEEEVSSLEKEINEMYVSSEAYKNIDLMKEKENKKKELDQALEEKMARWEYLFEKNENQ